MNAINRPSPDRPLHDLCVLTEPTGPGEWTVYFYAGDHRIELARVADPALAAQIATVFDVAIDRARSLLT